MLMLTVLALSWWDSGANKQRQLAVMLSCCQSPTYGGIMSYVKYECWVGLQHAKARRGRC